MRKALMLLAAAAVLAATALPAQAQRVGDRAFTTKYIGKVTAVEGGRTKVRIGRWYQFLARQEFWFPVTKLTFRRA